MTGSTGGHASAQEAIADLVGRYRLEPRMGRQLVALLATLTEDPRAPTAVTDPTRVVEDHLADSLVALELPSIRDARTLADLGSGAGLPGLPLAIALPDARVALVESSARKCEFIQNAAAVSGAGNVEVVNARAEDWPDGLSRFEFVTARALASLDVLLEYAAPLLRIGGCLVAWRGRRDPDAEAAARRAAGALGMEVGPVLEVSPYAGAIHRHLHLMSKVMDTPPRFPRRPGVATKRPLGARAGSSDRFRR